MTATGRPGELGIGDRVRFGGRDQTVIGVSGPVVRLADAGGQVVTVTVSGLLPEGDFAVLDARPRATRRAPSKRRRARSSSSARAASRFIPT